MAVVLVWSCTKDERNPNESGAEITSFIDDSTGIETVESLGSRWAAGEGWSVLSEPTLQIGGPNDQIAALFRISDAIRLEDGTIVVANDRGRQLLFIGPDGQRIRTIERLGEGPGEYKRIGDLASLYTHQVGAYDPGLRRVLVFDALGHLVRTVSIVGPSGELELIGPGPGGGFIFAHYSGFIRSPVDDRPEVYSRKTTYLRYDSLGQPRGPLAEVTAGNTWSQVGGPWGWIPTPFGSRSHAVVSEDRLYLGVGDAYEIQVVGFDGSITKMIRNRKSRTEVNHSMIQAYRRQVLGLNANGSGLERHMAEAIEPIPWPEYLPASTDIIWDDLGYLWVCEGQSPAEADPCWVVYEEAGSIMGRIDMPSGLEEVFDVGEDALLGLRFNRGLPEIVLLQLSRVHFEAKPDDSRGTR